MADEEFELWLGRSIPDRSYAGLVRRATNLAGGAARRSGTGSRFTGERIGRGSGAGRLLGSSGRHAGPRARRVIVKSRYVKMAGKGAARALAHLRYLQRDGTTREGERGTLYGADVDRADGKAFLERSVGDRNQFRFIVAAEDGAEYADLKPLVRRLMMQAEQDLGTKLDWVAVDHFNTGHPHSHILIRGTDDRGGDLIIAREYMTEGFRARAADLVNLDLGPRTDREIEQSRQREMTQERFTGIDRRLVAAIDRDGLVSPYAPDGVEQAARAGRLQTLGRLGLATEETRGRWRLDSELEATLRQMGKRGGIIATLHERLARERSAILPADYAIFEPSEVPAKPIVGRVLGTGLSDEHADRRYLIVEATDGRAWHVDVGQADDLPHTASIVRVAPAEIAVRKVDITVAEIAAANDGRYSVDIHLRHDRTATESFAQTHVRRLEAIRRATGGVERQSDGTWIVAPGHVERVKAYERQQAEQRPVVIQTLSSQALEHLPHHDGATWLDREPVDGSPAALGRGFGEEVRTALQLRRQWLIEQGLAEDKSDGARYPADMVARLQRRELLRVGAQLSRELSLDFAEARHGQPVQGVFKRVVEFGDGKYALIEKSREFTLVPWKPALEKRIGQTVSGIMRETGGISWTFGRERGIGR